MITYSTNWMGPVNMKWYRERGLIHSINGIETIHTYYYGGRIDIRDNTKEGYDGWNEYGVEPMHGEDWNAFGDFLDRLHGETVIPYDTLIMLFEAEYGKKIRWADE